MNRVINKQSGTIKEIEISEHSKRLNTGQLNICILLTGCIKLYCLWNAVYQFYFDCVLW